MIKWRKISLNSGLCPEEVGVNLQLLSVQYDDSKAAVRN